MSEQAPKLASFLLFYFLLVVNVQAVVQFSGQRKQVDKTEEHVSSEKSSDNPSVFLSKKEIRHEKRLKKITEKLRSKVEKWMSSSTDYWEDDLFRFGLLLIAAGALVSIILASWLAWIGGLAIIGGLVLVILVLLGY